MMRQEVALLHWTTDAGGDRVRMVGRSTDPGLIEVVAEALRRQLDTPTDSPENGEPPRRRPRTN